MYLPSTFILVKEEKGHQLHQTQTLRSLPSPAFSALPCYPPPSLSMSIGTYFQENNNNYKLIHFSFFPIRMIIIIKFINKKIY